MLNSQQLNEEQDQYMPRARTIKYGFFKNEELCANPMAARLLFAGLWTIADKEGRLEDRPKRIRAEIFPYDDVNIDDLLEILRVAEFIVRYEVDGKRYIAIPTWRSHQTPHPKEAPSVIPPPPGATEKPRLFLEEQRTGSGFSGTSPSIPSFPSIPSQSSIPSSPSHSREHENFENHTSTFNASENVADDVDVCLSSSPVSDPVKNSFPPQPPSGEGMAALYNRSRGTKKLNRTDATGFREAVDKLGCSQGEIEDAFGRFLEDDYWRKEKYPWRAFIKNFNRYLSNETPASEITAVVPARSASQEVSSAPAATATTSDTRSNDSASSLPWPVTVWNEIVTAGSPIVGWDPGSRTAKALQESLKNPVFAAQFYRICQTVQQMKAGGKLRNDVSLSWLLKDNRWLQIANGEYNWAIVDPSAGGGKASPMSPTDRCIAKIQAQIAARKAAEGAAAQ